MIGSSSPQALAARFTRVAQAWVADGPAERADRARRELLSAVAAAEPATLNTVARAVRRGAPAVSRAIDALVRVGLVERAQDPDNRRRVALSLTSEGRQRLASPSAGSADLLAKLERLAGGELRALERAIEIMERGL